MRKKIFFRLEVSDGYPPVAEESLWINEINDRLYEIDNIPFYTRDVSLGDIVSATQEEGILYFRSVIRDSGNSTLRVIFFDEERSNVCVIDYLKQLGCEVEFFSKKFIAVSIKKAEELADVISYLEAQAAEEILDYEIGKVVI
ncbi:MAG: DUF4265 domain-containing protein [Pelistega sp.]|nr:DUF4265 domain-containing protein [Pelistega sp.]